MRRERERGDKGKEDKKRGGGGREGGRRVK